MAAQEIEKAEKVPKTGLILDHIAEHGPKTEYDLYTELPRLSHGTIHFCLKKLTDSSVLTFIPSKKSEKRPKKLYNLTFMGTVTYLASFLHWRDSELRESEMAEYWKDFDEERQSEIVEFLEKQGRLLNYAPFQESRWLSDHYPGIIRGFLIIADTICHNPPSPYKKPLLIALFRAMRKESSEKETGNEKKDLIRRVEEAFRGEFTDLFFQIVVVTKSKGKTNNYRMRQLAEERLEERRHETAELEHAIRLFSKQDLTPEKRSKSKSVNGPSESS